MNWHREEEIISTKTYAPTGKGNCYVTKRTERTKTENINIPNLTGTYSHKHRHDYDFSKIIYRKGSVK